MKLVQITFHFEYIDEIEEILDDVPVRHYACHRRVEGRDSTGKLEGTQVYPGTMSVIQAMVEDGEVDRLIDALRAFRDIREGHRHLEAIVLPVERRLT